MCPFARFVEQMITLDNPSDETIELTPILSNVNNFFLVRDMERPIIIKPHTMIELPLHFMPSNLGQGDHLAKISFHSQQVRFFMPVMMVNTVE